MRRLPAILLGVVLCLGGCVSVGPDYKRPQLDAPGRFAACRDAAQGDAQAAAGLEQVQWWKRLNDPELDRLVEEAVRGNLDVAQAKARVLQARADVGIARAAQLPALKVGGTTTSSYSNGAATSTDQSLESIAVSPGTTYQAGFDVSWELDLFGGQRRKTEAARATYEASVEDLRSVVLTLLGDVARNYVELRSGQERLAIAKATAASQQQNVDVTTERFRLGLTSHLDVSQAVAQHAKTRSDIPGLEASVKQSIHRLGILTGNPPEALLARLSRAVPLPKPDGVFATGLPSGLLSRRPDLRKAERQLAAASANIGAATAGLYPTFDLTMGLGVQGNALTKFLGLANWYWSVIPSVTAPVFDAGKARADVSRKTAAYDESLAKYRTAFLTALEDVENALTALASEQETKRMLALAVRANEEALALARERYSKGLTSFLDVLSSEKSLYEAQDSLCKSSANELTDLVSLYKALGGGWNAAETAVASR
ncbi:efflux transporter outer membrane subunit [Fundidesulfovibrio terrae]|uniref:efflux transporter outer membrane subunit n=1 Tax=Fundidesulfovibrio terrae TaxID=2922866 RepID=UPI001FAFF32E|nr:efflux transporter outer membrane subunit [Fundidesulfovibrio terrae]